MPSRFFYAAALSVLTLGLTVTLSAPPALAQGARLSEPAGGFSYVPPPGWHVKALSTLKYQVAYTLLLGGFAPNINVVDQTLPASLDRYAQMNLLQIRQCYLDFTLLRTTAFTTASGLHGVRLNITGVPPGGRKEMHQIFYVVAAPDNHKLVATATWLAADGNKYMAATDNAMKTFKLQ